jgi:hypothetical protein
MAIMRFSQDHGFRRFSNKYAIFAGAGILIIAAAAFIPYARGAASFFLSYTPAWASGMSSAQSRMVLFDFLVSAQRFPLAALFFIGGIQLVSRREKLGWIPFWVFLFPVFILSFVFTHRVPTYMLYVYPLFLMLAAYGFINLLKSEKRFLEDKGIFRKKWIRTGIVLLFFLIFLISPWLRITLHIPFVEDGMTNLAVTPEEWREAAEILAGNRQAGDVIITSLPQVALYYGIHSDYCLNWNSLRQSREQEFADDLGNYVDVYAGVRCIASHDELMTVAESAPRGWLLISAYNLNHVNYTPDDVKTMIVTHLKFVEKTKNGTVLCFRWHEEAE